MAALEEATEKNSQLLRTWVISLVGEFFPDTLRPVFLFCIALAPLHNIVYLKASSPPSI